MINQILLVKDYDGDPKDGLDLFRIKILTEDENGIETVIYDNKMGIPDDYDSRTELGGGNIVVHKSK